MPSKQAQDFLLALALPAPAILFAIEPFIADAGRSGPELSGGDRCHAREVHGLRLLAVLALSSVLAVIAWRRSRGFGLPEREQVAWGLRALLGFPAYVGFRLYRRWPIREPCPNCHAQAARDRAACAECGARFPDPCAQRNRDLRLKSTGAALDPLISSVNRQEKTHGPGHREKGAA